MSYSSLWLIDKNFVGEEVADYGNSWLYSPIVWTVLASKYLPRDPYGNIQSMTGFRGQEVFSAKILPTVI